jgi:hypothetical protein
MEGGSLLLGHLTQQNAGFYHPKTEKNGGFIIQK